MADPTTDFLLGLDRYYREHHVTCNHRRQVIGGPGCICVVENKHDLARDIDAIEVAATIGLGSQQLTHTKAALQKIKEIAERMGTWDRIGSAPTGDTTP